MSLVTRSTEPWTFYFGSPAKKIRGRKQDLLEYEREFLAMERDDSQDG